MLPPALPRRRPGVAPAAPPGRGAPTGPKPLPVASDPTIDDNCLNPASVLLYYSGKVRRNAPNLHKHAIRLTTGGTHGRYGTEIDSIPTLAS